MKDFQYKEIRSTTMYKNNSRFNSKFKSYSPTKLLCNLIESRPQLSEAIS